ncbi:hypothetical protein GCM10023195_27290 [Actinoallomurus liliacearum]|uniref:DUF475 domain-containing protein n=1 Tax=Actinoallomurus liliacearum TaxID=1080073 RepID=A0ABP8TFU7_9ACTN
MPRKLAALAVPVGLLVSFVCFRGMGPFDVALVVFLAGVDNLVVIAKKVQSLGWWMRVYLTAGIVIQLIELVTIPPLIVALCAGRNPWGVYQLIGQPERYSLLLEGVHPQIVALGVGFIALAVMWFFADKENRVWLGIEKHIERFARWYKIGTIGGVLALLAIGSFWFSWTFLLLGVLGMAAFGAIKFSERRSEDLGQKPGAGGGKGFVRVELFEAALSIDMWVGTYSASSHLVDIVLGVLAGVLVMRILTVSLVQKLDELPYLASAAHWSLGLLAASWVIELWLPAVGSVAEVVCLMPLVVGWGHSVLSRRRQPAVI